MKKNLLYILAVVLLSFSCTEDDSVYVAPANGQEVKFTANLENSKQGSRTLYGEEVDSDNDGTNDGIKVNWVNGDKITVYGSTCATGRNQASYTVNVANSGTQNYADKLERIGEIGVQWGSEKTSDFYAVYPAIGGTFSPAGFEMEIREQQNNYFEKKATTNANGETVIVWEGTPYVDDINNPTMQDALMYAYEKGVTNGSDVDLTFKPFSTVLKFRLDGWTFFQVIKNENGEILSTESATSSEPAYISKIIIQVLDETAYQIAGKCNFKFENGVPTYVSGGSESAITIYPDYLPLSNGESVEFSAFVIPQEYELSENTPWVVTLETSNFGTHSFMMAPEIVNDVIPTILPGKIHKINIPNLPITSESQFDLTGHLDNWMKYIPRNVYLSELSLPGAWYATDANYQGNVTLAEQYKQGIRAFNIDCRVSTDKDGIGSSSHSTTENLVLACAGTESYSYQLFGGYNTTIGKTVKQAIDEIHTAFGGNSEEYVVIVLSIAEKPWTRGGILNGYHYGVNDPATVLSYINTMMNENAKTWGVYDKEISSNTTINEVLGKMIIKVNINTTYDKFTGDNYTMPSILASEASMASNSDYISGDIVKGSFSSMQTRDMYWGKKKTDLTYYYHQAQLTTNSDDKTDGTGTPSFGDRKAAIDNIIKQSSSIYEQNQHNGWFQLGIGGYIINSEDDEDRIAVAKAMNPYVLSEVNAKLNRETLDDGTVLEPSPIGMVLMNFCTVDDTEYQSMDLVKAIVTMNTKFYLNRNKDAEEWPGGSSPFE